MSCDTSVAIGGMNATCGIFIRKCAIFPSLSILSPFLLGASSPDFLPFCDLWTDGSVVKFSISSQVSRWRGLTTLSGCCLCNSTGLSIELRWKSFYVTSVSRPKSWPGSGRGAVALEMEFGGVTEGKQRRISATRS